MIQESSEILFLVPALVVVQSLLPNLIEWFVRLVQRQKRSPREQSLLASLAELRNELQTMSMMDEFAKYAKKEREIIKIEQELKELASLQSLNTSSARVAFQKTFYGLFGLLTVLLLWYYGRSPVVVLSEPDWLGPVPLNWVISFPTSVDGGIGLPFWIFASRSLYSLVKRTLV